MEKVMRQLRYEESVIVKSINKAGEMIVMWDVDIKVTKVLTTTFTIEAHILDPDKNMDWWFIGFCVNANDQTKRNQWKVIERRKELQDTRQIIAWDFNDITSNREKWDGRREEGSFREFNDFINKNELIDLGFEGNPQTWSNHWSQKGRLNKNQTGPFEMELGAKCLIEQKLGA